MRVTSIVRPFAGEERTFFLPLGSQRAIEAKCERALGEVYSRVWTVNSESPAGYRFGVDDYRETILQALIGGGLTNAAATSLVIQNVDGRPASEFALLACEILTAWAWGFEPGKTQTPETESGAGSAPNASTSASSTGTARRSGTRRAKSTK